MYKWRLTWNIVVGLLAFASMAESTRADLSFFVPATGNWNVAGNWTGGFVPGNEAGTPKIAIIDNGGTATINSTIPELNQVWVGDGPGSGILNVTSGTLTATATDQTGIIVVGRTVEQIGENSGSQLNVSGGSVITDGMEAGQVFGAFNSDNVQIVISGTGLVTVKNFLRVGHGDSGATFGGEGVMTVRDNGQFIHDGTGTLPFINDFIAFGFNGGGGVNGGNNGTLNLEDNAIFNSKRPVRFGWVEEGHGTLNISDNAQLIIDSGELSAAAIMFGDFNNSTVGTGQRRPTGIANQSGGTVTVGTDAARPRWIAIGGSGYGEYNMTGGKLNIFVRDGLNIGDTDQVQHPGEGIFNLSGTGVVNATEITLGKIGRATGIFNQDGGTVNVGISTPDGNFVDRIDTLGEQLALDDNYDGRLILGAGFDQADPAFPQVGASSGTYNLMNGTLHVRGMNVGHLGQGTFTQTGGTAIADVGILVAFGQNSQAVPSTGIMNLNGGVMETAAIGGGGGGNSTVNFNGTTVRATIDQPDFIVNLTTANVVGAEGLIIDSAGFDVSSNASFSGAGGHIKRGAGTSAFSANTSYAGPTVVEAGTHLVNGTHSGTGAFTVQADATLGGTGSIAGAVNVTGDGIISPGDNGIESLATGSVSFGSNGIFDVQIDAAGNTSDLLVVNGNLNLSGANDMLRLSLLAGSLPEVGPLTIATYTGTLTGTFNLDNADVIVNYGTGTNSSITITNIMSIDSAGLDGDYNNDGIVNAADYTVWRNNLGDLTEANINNNGDGGGVDVSDYTFWKANYGNMAPGAGGLAGVSPVPEPASAFLAIIGLAAVFARRAGRSA